MERDFTKCALDLKKKKCLNTGRKSIYSAVEYEIEDYVQEARRQKSIVTIRSIIKKLHELSPESQVKTHNSKRLWTYRFLARHGFSLRRVTRTVVLTDSVLRERLNSFHRAVMERWNRVRETIFLNMDQTSVLFGDHSVMTVATRGERSVQAFSPSTPGDRVTAALTIASNGDKLPPFVIFKGTIEGRVSREFVRRENPYPDDLMYSCQSSAWMTDELMKRWLDQVLLPYVFSKLRGTVCMILDSFAVHLKPFVRAFAAEHEIEILYIPGGLTCELQPLDIGVNGPFKHWLREGSIDRPSFDTWTASEKRLEIARAISRSWSMISVPTVTNSFNRVLISTVNEIRDSEEVE